MKILKWEGGTLVDYSDHVIRPCDNYWVDRTPTHDPIRDERERFERAWLESLSKERYLKLGGVVH